MPDSLIFPDWNSPGSVIKVYRDPDAKDIVFAADGANIISSFTLRELRAILEHFEAANDG